MANRCVAWMLLIFLGWTGAHRCYCGRGWSGVLYLFTLGLCLVGWLGDFCELDDMVDQANKRPRASGHYSQRHAQAARRGDGYVRVEDGNQGPRGGAYPGAAAAAAVANAGPVVGAELPPGLMVMSEVPIGSVDPATGIANMQPAPAVVVRGSERYKAWGGGFYGLNPQYHEPGVETRVGRGASFVSAGLPADPATASLLSVSPDYGATGSGSSGGVAAATEEPSASADPSGPAVTADTFLSPSAPPRGARPGEAADARAFLPPAGADAGPGADVFLGQGAARGGGGAVSWPPRGKYDDDDGGVDL